MTSSLATDSDKAWEGQIYYKHKGTFVARYEAFWAVVRRESSRGLQRIDLFRSQCSVDTTSDIFIPLHDVLHVLNREARGRRFAFQVLCTDCKYHLATECAHDRERWVRRLEYLLFGPPQSGVVYEHQVLVVPNSHSEQLHLSGRYVVRITDSHIALFTSTGTLPTRFLYSLSDIARTRYTNFTNSGQKCSVLVLYCKSENDITEQGEMQSHHSQLTRHVSSSKMVADEDMFVFQTQSASTISRTIDHRLKELVKKEKLKTSSNQLQTNLSSSLPLPTEPHPLQLSPSLPIATTNEATPHINGNHYVKKPCPPPRPIRTNTPINRPVEAREEQKDATLLEPTALTRSQEPQYILEASEGNAMNAKPKKIPIPLPRKKLSFDSTVQSGSHPSNPPNFTPTAKPRTALPRKQISQSASSLDNPSPETAIVAALTDSNQSTNSKIVSSTSDLVSGGTKGVDHRPTYINLNSADKTQRETRQEDVEKVEDDSVGEYNKGSASAHRQPTYYNLSPSQSNDLLTAGDIAGSERPPEIPPHERYYNMPPSKSSEVLSTAVSEAQHEQGNSSPAREPDNSSVNDQSPTLDDFLARILQRRRESKDISEACDEKRENFPSSRLAVGSTRTKDPRLMMQVIGMPGTASTAPTPQYYNLPPVLRYRGMSEDEWSEEEEKGMNFGDSYGEKEFRSAWLRRDSGAQKEWRHSIQEEDLRKEHSHDCGTPTYLKILPSTIHRSHPPPQPNDQASSAKTPALIDVTANKAPSIEPVPSIPEENESSSTPDSGSPLWGTRRPWSRQASVVSPLTLGGRENSPHSPTVPDSPVISHSNSRPTHKRRSFHRKSRKLVDHSAVAGDGRMTSKKRALPAHRRAIRKKSTGKNGPLPSLPHQDGSDSDNEVDSDYEWAEVGEALSDTGSDVYSHPFDLPPPSIDSNPRLSSSCSELAPCLPPSPVTPNDPLSSLSHRPPALLPTLSQDVIVFPNLAHVESPVTPPKSGVLLKRNNIQRSFSLDDLDHTPRIYEDLESQTVYDYVRDDEEDDYDYAAVPNRSVANFFPCKIGEYVDIKRDSPSHSSPSSPAASSPAPGRAHPLHSRQHPPRPAPRPLTSLPITDV